MLAVNAGVALDAKTQAVYKALWIEGLDDLSPEVLRAAFQKTLRECFYWPIKVADIRRYVASAKTNATNLAAEDAWQRVLEIRRVHWNPDFPGSFARVFSRLSAQVQTACRAAGVFREFTSAEFEKGALHTWAKKRFIESFNAWGESEADKFLLPDGEIKRLLADAAKSKTLPTPKESFESLHERGLQYAAQNRAAAPLLAVNRAVTVRRSLFGTEEEREIANRALHEKETDPAIADRLRAQKAALAAKGDKLA